MSKLAVPEKLENFIGFDHLAMQFWHELAAEMSKDWFAANKQRYETQWVAPMTALLGRAAAGLRAAYKPLVLGAPKVWRIYRDVRFSADKTPYKTHVGGAITIAGKVTGESSNAALYVQFGLDEDLVGVGSYRFDAAKLARWRKAVAGAPGVELQKLVAKLRKAGYVVRGHDDYKRVPSGFEPDHPRAELLKMRGVIGAFPEIPAGLLHKPGLADWLIKHGKATAPLVIWLHRHVG